MPAKRETIGIGMKVRPELDQRATQEVLRDVTALHKKLASLKIDWGHVAKQARANVEEIQSMSAAAERFKDSLSKATQKSLKNFEALGKKLEDAQHKAAAISSAYGDTKDPKAKEALAEELSAVSATIADLNKQIEDHTKTDFKHVRSLDSVAKAQKRFVQGLEKAADYTGKNFGRDLASAIGKLGQGGPGGLKAALSGALGAGAQGVGGVVARRAQREQEMADLTGKGPGAASFSTLAKSAGAIAAAAVALTAFWEVLKAASQHMTKLNKGLIDGGGFARDASQNISNYRQSVDRLRQATIDAHKGLLAYGANSEAAAKAIGAFSKETTGSLVRTEQTLIRLGKGNLTKGVEEFSKTAVVYGKALGMEADEVGSLMGRFVTEAGYASEDVQDLMGNVVKAAATANMPMTKFMDIFRQVLPDVELYRNRLEELTGTIKLLSKTMSAKDVKNFMDAFAKGFGQTDFKQRLKTTLIAGTGFVSKTLDKDFQLKARSIAKNFQNYGIDEDQMVAALKKGTKGMADLMAVAQGRASQRGEEISATAVSDAMKLAGYESDRQKGGPLNLATAMRGAGMGATFKILEKQSQAFTTGYSGLAEHVIKQTGVTEQQYEALRSMNETFQVYQAQLSKFGKTQSRSMNDALRKVLAERGETDMRKATKEDLIDAATLSNKFDEAAKSSKSMQQLAVEQTTLTQSIDEKIDNVLAFFLEKIYAVLDKYILSVLNDLYEYLALGGKNNLGELQQRHVDRQSVKKEELEQASKKEQDRYANVWRKIEETKKSGASGPQEWIDSMKGSISVEDLRGTSAAFSNFAKLQAYKTGKYTEEEAEAVAVRVQKQMQYGIMNNDVNAALWALKDTPGDWEEAFKMLNSMIAKKNIDQETDAAARRGGTKSVADQEKERLAKEKQDMLDLSGEVEVLTEGGSPRTPGGPITLPEVDITSEGGASRKPGVGTPAEAVTEQGQAQVEATQDTKASVVEATSKVQLGVEDLYKLVDKGIKLESSFLGGPYRNVIKEATLESFRTALLEFAILEAKMMSDDNLSDFGKELASRGREVMDEGVTADDLLDVGGEGGRAFDDAIADAKLRKGSRQTGGPIPDTGYYRLHRGEYVVPAMPASSPAGGGSSPTIVYLNVYGTNMTPQQFEGSVYAVMDKVARRS